MLEEKQDIMRCIVEYSAETEEVIAKYELSNFDLEKFQKEFGVYDSGNPMFDCYPIADVNTSLIQRYLVRQIDWKFEKRDYFLEVSTM